MRNVLIVGLVLVAGCGTNVADGVSIEDARSTCNIVLGRTGAFDAMIAEAEWSRDNGISPIEFDNNFVDACAAVWVDRSICVACGNMITSAVWN